MTTPKLLSGGNPQIDKGYGEAPVQAYLAAMPGWTAPIGRSIDALVTSTVPGVRKAVKYNTPLYGAPDRDDWFMSFHVFTRYVKLAFFGGTLLDPIPPEPSKSGTTRYFHIREQDLWDEALLAKWIRQAALLPGEKL